MYVINPDPPARAGQLRKSTGLTFPLLSDPGYKMAQQFGLRGSNRPMAGLVGFVIIDPRGIIRVQRVDVQFGRRAGYILDVVRRLRKST